MSGDVKAAIERLNLRMADLAHFGEHELMHDIVTVLAEVERLQSSVPQRTIDYLQAELVKQMKRTTCPVCSAQVRPSADPEADQ